MLKQIRRVGLGLALVLSTLAAGPAQSENLLCSGAESSIGLVVVGCDSALRSGDTGAPAAPGTPVAASPPVCRDATGTVIPCSTGELGRWNGTCYVRPASPQPPPEDPIWAGRTGGTIVQCASPDGAVLTLDYVPTILIDLPDPEDLARSAVATMNLPAADINLTPQPNLAEPNILIHRDNHLWVPAGTLTPRTTSASDAGLTVTLTATPSSVTFTSRDGDATTSVTCDPAHLNGPPPNPHATPAACALVWQHPSRNTSTGQYTITATVTWTITWQGPGQSGTLTTTPTSTVQVAVTDYPVRLIPNHG